MTLSKNLIFLCNLCLAAVIGVVAAEPTTIYSFRGGASSAGIELGAKGLACFREILGENVTDQNATETELSVAIFMAYGEEGIDKVCGFTKHRRLLRKKATNNAAKTTTDAASENRNNAVDEERRAQSSCGTFTVAEFPKYQESYTAYAAETFDSFLPEAGVTDKGVRTSPTQMISEAQVVLDESLEAEYSANLCETYFGAITDVLSIPDVVVIKQGAILDGINRFSCGIAQSVALGTQNKMRTLIASGVKHDILINQAEIRATYVNMVSYSDQMCSTSASISTLFEEIEGVKEKFAKRL